MSNFTNYRENTIKQNSYNANEKFYIQPSDKSTPLIVRADIEANNGKLLSRNNYWNSDTYYFDINVYMQFTNKEDVTDNTARLAFFNGNSKIMEFDLFRTFVYKDISCNQISAIRATDIGNVTISLLRDLDGTAGTPLDLRFYDNSVNDSTTTSATRTLFLPDLTVTVDSHLANIPGVGTMTLGEYMNGFEFNRSTSGFYNTTGTAFMAITTANTTNTQIYANRASGNPFTVLNCRPGQMVRIKVIIVGYNPNPVYGYHVTETKAIST